MSNKEIILKRLLEDKHITKKEKSVFTNDTKNALKINGEITGQKAIKNIINGREVRE